MDKKSIRILGKNKWPLLKIIKLKQKEKEND